MRAVLPWLLISAPLQAQVPDMYERIAHYYGVDPQHVYQQALQTSGYRSRFADTPQPWPWTITLGEGESRQRLYVSDRATLYAVLQAALAADIAVAIGPLGLVVDPDEWPSLWAATHPRANLNRAVQRLVAPVEPAGRSVAPVFNTPNAQRYTPLINRIAEREGMDPYLVHAVVAAESAYDPAAISSAGAVGLMQLMPATAERFGLDRTQRHHPEGNLQAGIRYLQFLERRFEGDLELMLAAYNAGEGAVLKHGRRIPPYRETQNYVVRVQRHLQRLNRRPVEAPSG